MANLLFYINSSNIFSINGFLFITKDGKFMGVFIFLFMFVCVRDTYINNGPIFLKIFIRMGSHQRKKSLNFGDIGIIYQVLKS